MTDIVFQITAEKAELLEVKEELINKRSRLQDDIYRIETTIIEINCKIKLYTDILKNKYVVQCKHSYSMYGVCSQCGKKNEYDRFGNWENKDEGDM